jgi:hypothetical protein
MRQMPSYIALGEIFSSSAFRLEHRSGCDFFPDCSTDSKLILRVLVLSISLFVPPFPGVSIYPSLTDYFTFYILGRHCLVPIFPDPFCYQGVSAAPFFLKDFLSSFVHWYILTGPTAGSRSSPPASSNQLGQSPAGEENTLPKLRSPRQIRHTS